MPSTDVLDCITVAHLSFGLLVLVESYDGH